MKINSIVFLGVLFGLIVNANRAECGDGDGFGEGDRSIASGMPSSLDAKNEPEIVQKVRSRSYLGGSDESDLRVQSQLLKPTRKISPTVEEEAEPASDD